MFHEESLVTTVFKIINLGVLIAATIYLFKKNFGSIQASIAQEELEDLKLKEENKLLKRAVDQTDNQAFKFREWVDRIDKNIRLWHEKVNEERKVKAQEQDLIIQKIQGKIEQQEQSIVLNDIQKQAGARAIKDAEQKLKSKAEGSQGQAYINNLINVLKRS